MFAGGALRRTQIDDGETLAATLDAVGLSRAAIGSRVSGQGRPCLSSIAGSIDLNLHQSEGDNGKPQRLDLGRVAFIGIELTNELAFLRAWRTHGTPDRTPLNAR